MRRLLAPSTRGETGIDHAAPSGLRIVCLIPAMTSGGAERVMSRLTAHLAERHDVTIVTWEQPGTPSFYPLPKAVHLLQTGALGGRGPLRLWYVARRVRAVRSAVRSRGPDVVVSFMDVMNVAALVGCLGTGVPVVVSERVDPNHHRIGRVKGLLRNWSYPLAYVLVVQTLRVKAYFATSMAPRIRIVANPIPAPVTIARPERVGPGGRWRMIVVGRLEQRQKGLDRLIDAFSLIADDHPDWDMVLIGEGPDRQMLQERIAQLGLCERVALQGTVADIDQELARSHLMAFPSRYEGFPNALAEGLAAGLPAVGYAGVSGVEDLIVDGQTGLLIPAAGSHRVLARALSDLMRDAPRRALMGAAARGHVAQWSPERVLGQWEQLLAEAACSK